MLPLRSTAGPPPHDADDKDQKDVTKHSTQNYSDSIEKFHCHQERSWLFWLDCGSTWRKVALCSPVP